MMRMNGRYGGPRRAPQSVPRELALELARERDAYAEALHRERLEVERLRALNDELASAPPQVEPDDVEEAEAEGVHEAELARLERRVEDLLGDISRLRRNQERELAACARKGARDALAGMLEVRDTMARALELLAGEGGPWERGFAGALEQLDASLSRGGVVRFGEVGERFDPAVHEAVGLEAAAGVAPGSVLRVERLGFRFDGDGALLRPAQVVVTA